MADTRIKPWSERVGKMPGAPDGVIRFAMLEEIDELRSALASLPAEVDDEGLPDIGRPDLIPEPQMKVLGKEYLRRTKGGYVDKLVVLREIIQRTYSQAYQKGISRNGE